MEHSGLMDGSLCAAIGCPPESGLCQEFEKIAAMHEIARGQDMPIDPARPALVYLASGAVKLVGRASGGRDQIVAFHLQGEILSVAGDAMHQYRLTALIDTMAVVFDEADFLECASANPAILRAIIERTQSALHRSRDKAVSLGRKSAQERVAGFLYALAKRMTPADNGKCALDLPMSRRDIGDSLGLTIETISRQFSELKSAGLIETCGRSRVLLPDIGALARRAGHLDGAEPAIAGS